MRGRKKQVPPAQPIDKSSAYVGSIVEAVRGREAGRIFIIVGGGGADRVYIADGRKRRLARPKLKGIRHITVTGVCESARELLSEGKFTDGDIRRAIRAAEKIKPPKGEPDAEG